MQSDRRLRFHSTGNDMLLCYSKSTPDLSNVILTVVNLDFRYRQSGFVQLDLPSLGVDAGLPYLAEDLLGGGRYIWEGPRNYVELDPHGLPLHILRIGNLE